MMLFMLESGQAQFIKDLALQRRLLLWAGGVYLAWWFVIHATFPQAFNPLGSRLAVCATIAGVWTWTYLSQWARRHSRVLFVGCVWLITVHYYYLFYENGPDINWVVGSYITVMAINLCLLSNAILLTYSLFVMVLSSALCVALPELQQSVFLPGLLTLLVQANLGLRSRLGIINSLGQSNERFQLLFHSSFDSILVHENGIIVNANESASKALGYSFSELIGQNVLSILHPDARQIGAEKLRLEEVAPYETRAISKEGQTIEIEVRAKNFMYDNKPARLVTMQDISVRKKAERDRVAAMSLAENLRIRDEFISIASHELKTPISALKLQTHMIERELRKKTDGDSDHKAISVINLFNRQLKRLNELVDTMLDVSRIAAGRLVLERSDIDLAAMVRQAVNDLVLQNANGTGEILVNAPHELKVNADRQRLEQVLENLLSNAIKYGEKKLILIDASRRDNEVVLNVRDHGRGISTEFIDKVFDRFERENNTQAVGGLGLGLYIARQLIEAHGGTISVASRPGGPTDFTVRLPRRPN